MTQKLHLAIALLAGLLWLGSCQPKENRDTLRICTSNIRGDKPVDGVNQWQYRRDSLCNLYLHHALDVVGLQEAVPAQRADICRLTGYAFVGDSTLLDPILYNPARVEPLENGMFWYSESMMPHTRGWDAKYERYCTWARFKDKRNDKEFYVFNTHFDHRGDTARTESARLLVKQAASIAGNTPLFIIGDLNSHDYTEAYRVMATNYTDSRLATPLAFGPEGTGHNFGGVHPVRIDYIFVNDGVEILTYRAVDEAYEGNRFPSDHYPVYVEATIK